MIEARAEARSVQPARRQTSVGHRLSTHRDQPTQRRGAQHTPAILRANDPSRVSVAVTERPAITPRATSSHAVAPGSSTWNADGVRARSADRCADRDRGALRIERHLLADDRREIRVEREQEPLDVATLGVPARNPIRPAPIGRLSRHTADAPVTLSRPAQPRKKSRPRACAAVSALSKPHTACPTMTRHCLPSSVHVSSEIRTFVRDSARHRTMSRRSAANTTASHFLV